MGKVKDVMVYTKLIILAVISFVLINNSQTNIPTLLQNESDVSILSTNIHYRPLYILDYRFVAIFKKEGLSRWQLTHPAHSRKFRFAELHAAFCCCFKT